jgi:hypothetical protein
LCVISKLTARHKTFGQSLSSLEKHFLFGELNSLH